MREYIHDLYAIQTIDLLIQERQKQQAAVPQELQSLREQVATLNSDEQAQQTQNQALTQAISQLRLTNDEEQQKLRKWEARLAELKNPRDYASLAREIEATKRQLKDNEGKLAQLNSEKNASDAVLTDLEDKHALLTSNLKAAEERFAAAHSDSQQALENAISRRERLLPSIPQPILRRYDMIRSKRAGVGLCGVEEGCCSGCHLRLPPQLYNTLQRGEAIEQCPNCHRLIVWQAFLPNEDATISPTAAQASTP